MHDPTPSLCRAERDLEIHYQAPRLAFGGDLNELNVSIVDCQ